VSLPVIVLDVDDTLYLETEFVRSGFRAAGAWLKDEHGVDGLSETAWTLFQTEDRTRIFNLALDQVWPDAPGGLIRALIEVYRSHHPDITLAPDAKRLLDAMKGERLAAITDGYADTQLNKVEALGLTEYCEPVIRTGVWGRDYWKPHPRAFRAVQEHYGVGGGDCVYIGDNPAKDFVGARALGWRTLRLRREGGLHAEAEAAPGHDADDTIADLDALIATPERLRPTPTVAAAGLTV
jgi:putative hydrolase of the HAD superfamily